MGFASADHFLAAISTSQWLEWRAWARIRGGSLGIGPQRQDFHASFIAFHAEQRRKNDATMADFMMPWIDVEPVAEEDDD